MLIDGTRTTKHFHKQDNEELEAVAVLAGDALSEAHGPNHENPVHECAKDGVRDFSDKLADGEDVGRVDATGRLANEDTPVEDPKRLELGDDDHREDDNPETIGAAISKANTKKELATHIPKTRYWRSRTLLPSWRNDSEMKSEMNAWTKRRLKTYSGERHKAQLFRLTTSVS